MIDVHEVETPAQLRQFIDLPWRLYKGNRNWVPPIKKEVAAMLNHEHYPFWEHARGTIFLALKDGRVAGRISAQVDDNYNDLWNEKLGSFGFFECEDDQETANALLGAAADWVKAQGMTVLRGPMSPSSNDEWGVLLDALQPAVLPAPP
jgi:hypothetical protein